MRGLCRRGRRMEGKGAVLTHAHGDGMVSGVESVQRKREEGKRLQAWKAWRAWEEPAKGMHLPVHASL